MTCATCGRENPPHLTFCQECGQRLGPRIAPPTPPIGLGGDARVQVPSASGAPGGWGPSSDFRAANPHRLATSLGGATPTPAAAPSGERYGAPSAPPGYGGGERPCRVCATDNGPGLRYCTSCGSTLSSPLGAPASVGSSSGPSAPSIFEAKADLHEASALPPVATITPVRVIDLSPGGARSNGTPRVCGRCRGVVDPNAQFCKFCGASLAEAAAPGGLPLPPLPAQAPELSGGTPVPAPVAQMRQMPPQPLPQAPFAPAPIPLAKGLPHTAPARAPTAGMAAALADGGASLLRQTPIGERMPGPPPPVVEPPAAPALLAPRAGIRGRLVVIAKSGADGASYPFRDTLDVGRLEGQIIVGEDPYLSPRHVRIAWTGTKLVLRDLASTNGVYIRLVGARNMNAGAEEKRRRGGPASPGQPPGEVAVPLQDQDLILVGQQVLRFDVASHGAHAEAGFGPATEHGTLLFGSPAAPRYARLSQRTVEGVTRDVYYVRKVETVLGRESGDVVFTEDPFLSRRHAAIRVLGKDGEPLHAGFRAPTSASAEGHDGVSFALVDLESSNGTFLRIRDAIDLIAGDHFRIGQQLFRVDFEQEAPRAGVR